MPDEHFGRTTVFYVILATVNIGNAYSLRTGFRVLEVQPHLRQTEDLAALCLHCRLEREMVRVTHNEDRFPNHNLIY